MTRRILLGFRWPAESAGPLRIASDPRSAPEAHTDDNCRQILASCRRAMRD